MATKGIDVSKHQGKIDWEKVKASGIEFAIIRCGYGGNYANQDDPQFARNVAECKRLGIPFGVYLYSYANSVEKAKSEAEHCKRLIKGLTFDFPVFYDLEDKTTGACSNALILEIAKTFVNAMQPVLTGIYANKYWRETKLTDKWYDTVPFWLAHYASKTDYKGHYDIWQYTSAGKVDGISGHCDMNYCYTDYVKKADTPAQTTQPAKKSIDEIAQEVRKGLWGNGEERRKKLEAAGYEYEAVRKRVNELIAAEKTPVNTVKPAQPVKYTKGQIIALHHTPLYISSTAKKPSSYKSGTYYIYDGEKVNGRYKITSKKFMCGLKPAKFYVTGWVELK